MTKIIQITDPHIGPNAEFSLAGVQTLATFQAVVEDAKRLSPDLFLITGDIAAESNLSAYQQFFDTMNASGISMAWLPGNHDVAEVVESADGASPYRKIYDIDNWRILMMDSVLPGSPKGRFGESELQLLEQLLAENTQDYVLVCTHHHPVPVGSAWLDRQCISDADDFLRIIFADSRVRGVKWGHIHQEFQEIRDGVLLASAPSTCMQFKPKSDDFALDGQMPGYRVIELLADGSIQTEVHRTPIADFRVELNSLGY